MMTELDRVKYLTSQSETMHSSRLSTNNWTQFSNSSSRWCFHLSDGEVVRHTFNNDTKSADNVCNGHQHHMYNIYKCKNTFNRTICTQGDQPFGNIHIN